VAHASLWPWMRWIHPCSFALRPAARRESHRPREARRRGGPPPPAGDASAPPLARLAVAPAAALDGSAVRTLLPLLHKRGGELRLSR
jgi:hypothetical protein